MVTLSGVDVVVLLLLLLFPPPSTSGPVLGGASVPSGLGGAGIGKTRMAGSGFTGSAPPISPGLVGVVAAVVVTGTGMTTEGPAVGGPGGITAGAIVRFREGATAGSVGVVMFGGPKKMTSVRENVLEWSMLSEWKKEIKVD